MPVPFEVHYSSEWHDKILSDDIDYTKNKTDIDLQSHLTYVVQRGICLYGKPINEVFGDINWQIFMEGVLDDFNWIIEDENILETPFYGVLNMCRVLQLAQEDKHLAHSKDEGGEWALQNLPEQFHSPYFSKHLTLIIHQSKLMKAKDGQMAKFGTKKRCLH